MEATNQGAPLDDVQTRWKPATVAETGGGTERESDSDAESATESAFEADADAEARSAPPPSGRGSGGGAALESESASQTASRLALGASPPPRERAPSKGSAPLPPGGVGGGLAEAQEADRASAPSSGRAKPEAPPREGPRVRRSWTGALLETDGSWAELGQRAGIGVLLAASYGVALGARDGGIAMLTHAVGVPAALVAVAMLGLPALYVVLALFDAPLSVRKAGGAAVAGVASAGLVLAGTAPLAALYVVTSGSADAASVAGGIGLALGGLLGLRHLARALRAALETADSATRFVAALSQTGFAVFAMLLAWRVWSSLLPLVGGAS